MRQIALAAAVALALAGCGGAAEETEELTPPSGQRPALSDVVNVLELRAAFNDDRGRPRLVLLLSPT